MILLDTDHLTILVNRRASLHAKLVTRLENAMDEVAIPVVSVEEQCKGWLAQIGRARDIYAQMPPYERLTFTGLLAVRLEPSGAACTR